MEPDICAPPHDNTLDLSDLELCSKCKSALLDKFMNMINGISIDKTWNQEDINKHNYEKTNRES